MVDAVRDVLAHIESTGEEGDREFQDLIGVLDAIREGEVPEAPSPHGATRACGAAREQPGEGPALTVAPAREGGPASSEGASDAGGTRWRRARSASRSGSSHDLMNMVGELVLARNQILQHAGHWGDSELTAPFSA